MTSGPAGFSRSNGPPLPPDPGGDDPLAGDPLLEGGPAAPPPPEQQRPRGHRQRRTTLPRATRGWSRSIVWSLIGLTVFATLYGLLARIDSSIEAPGTLRPVGGVTGVSSPFNALVQRVLVREGQSVRRGQLLLQLRDEALWKQRRQLLAITEAWNREVERLSLQLGLPASSPATPAERLQLQVSQQEVRLRSLAALEEAARSRIGTQQQLSDLQGLQRKLTINRSISERLRTLKRAGAISQLELDRQREREIEVEAAVQRTRQEVQASLRRERESGYKAQQISVANLKQLFSYLDNARQQLHESRNRLLELDERLALSGLRAPQAGRVFDLSVRQGEIASPARPALKIVPEGGGPLEAVLEVSNRDIGFVREGMPVEVRVTSFPFTEYGALRGRLTRLSEDALPPDPTHAQDYFKATVRLDAGSLQRDGKRFGLQPGMAVTGLLQLGPRPVISLLGDRLGSFLDSSRSIR
ncbi:MAG: HlyD family efflux transporter periplasmic adaptor subunit [Synechococcaceae cyanobacterium]|nr:HlyD family efflux transporter periplasmic adaptor subunit [Synechococcaceae cyanobacterium]